MKMKMMIIKQTSQFIRYVHTDPIIHFRILSIFEVEPSNFVQLELVSY